MSTPHTPSPTGSVIGPLESGVKNGTVMETRSGPEPISKEIYNVETEKNKPTKQEAETNEKNLQQSASYLGELVFKIRCTVQLTQIKDCYNFVVF